MLEVDYQQSLAETLEAIPCRVQLPAEWEEFFSRTGHLPSLDGDQRRFVRKHRPGLAVLELGPSLPAIYRREQTASVLTKNVSKAGIAFLHTEQLFPEEQAVVWLPEGKLRIIIARCQRLGENCYEIAGHFSSAAAANSAGARRVAAGG